MKTITKLIVVFMSLVFVASASAQPGYSKVFYSDNIALIASAVIQTQDDSFILAGQENNNGLCIKITESGSIVWKKSLDYSGNQIGTEFSSLASADSCFIIAGSYFDTIADHSNLLIVKIGPGGDTLWSKAVDFGIYSTASSIIQTFDHGYIVAGQTSDNTGAYKIVLCKLDDSGELEWSRVTSNPNSSLSLSIHQTADSGFIITGYESSSSPVQNRALLIKLDASGQESWSKLYGKTSFNFAANDLVIAPDGYFICMYDNLDWGNIIVMKTDLSGTTDWTKGYSNIMLYSYGNRKILRMNEASDGSLAIVSSGQLLNLDRSGGINWPKTLSMDGGDMTVTRNHGYLLVGNGPLWGVKSPLHYLPHIGILSIDSLGENGAFCISDGWANLWQETLLSSSTTYPFEDAGMMKPIKAVISNPVILAEAGCVSFLGGLTENNDENVLSIYPNPSSGYITLSCDRIENFEQLEIFDSYSRKVYSSSDPSLMGTAIDLKALKPGIHVLRLRYDHQSLTRKFIIK